jgi:hypothetical protein
MGGSDNHMNPRRARRELWREMGLDQYGLPLRTDEPNEPTPEQKLQRELNARFPRAKHKTVVEYEGKFYQRRYRPTMFEHAVPTLFDCRWTEVPAGTEGRPGKPARGPSHPRQTFGTGRTRDVVQEHLKKRR